MALPLLWAVAVLLGCLGYAEYLSDAGEPHSFGDVFYRSLALVQFEGGAVDPPVPWTLEVARVLAPVVVAVAVITAIIALFRRQFRRLRARLMSDHVVVCGLGARGELLARRFKEAQRRESLWRRFRSGVVAVERDEEAPGIEDCREEGVIVLTGDMTEESVLRRAGVAQARCVIAVAGDEGVNAEVAIRARALAADRRKPLEVYVHIVDAELCRLLRGKEPLTSVPGAVRLHFFNVFESGTRAWLSEHPPFGGPGGGDDRAPHLVVVGLGQMGRNLVVAAMREWLTLHPETALPGEGGRSAPRPKITLVDNEAERKMQDVLLVDHPALDTYSRLEYADIDVTTPSFGKADFLFEGERCTATTIYVCFDDDTLALSTALALHQKVKDHDVRIVVRMREQGGLATLLFGGETPGDEGEFENLRAFMLVEETCTPELVLGETKNERIARAAHADYVRNEEEKLRVQELRGETPQPNPSLVDWYQLPEDFKESNRRQADHLAVKLAAIGCKTAEKGDPDAIDLPPEELQRLAQMEHDRYWAEKLFEGWTYAPGPKDPKRKTNPTLVPWRELDEKTKEVDRITVRRIPAYLAEVGLCIVPARARRPGLLPAGTYESVARAIHEEYVRRDLEKGETRDTNPSLCEWDELPATLKDSNRRQAEHLAPKLAAVGCAVEPTAGAGAEPAVFSEEEIERLAELEHERWRGEREAAGWALADQKDLERRGSPYMVPWEKLPEEIREYDREAVRALPAVLARLGYRIVRVGPQDRVDRPMARGGRAG